MKKGIIGSIIFCLLFTVVACDKNPTAPEITDINGSWSGTTSQNNSFTLTIANDKITKWKIKVQSGGMTQEVNTYYCSVPITDHMFTLTSGGWPQPKLRIEGEFKSNSKCKGTFSFGGTDGSWTVRR